MATSTSINNVSRTFTATVTVDQYLLTRLDLGKVNVATKDSDDVLVGFSDRKINQSDAGPIQLINGGGTVIAVAATTVTAGDAVYRASGGKIETAITGVVTVTGDAVGHSLQDAVANDEIEILLA